jgi:hypothetical protein
MPTMKTTVNSLDVTKFLDFINNQQRKAEALLVLDMMKEITGKEPKMWGKSIIGFDNYQYKYKSGREGEWFMLGFSPRKLQLSFYIMPGYQDYSTILSKLGKYTNGKSCFYIKDLSVVDTDVLKELLKTGYNNFKAQLVDGIYHQQT